MHTSQTFPKLVALLSLFFVTSLAQADDLVIPALVGQTGGSASFGKGETDAYQLAAEEWNARGGVKGRQIRLQIEDTQTSERQIVSAFHRLAASKPPVILGPTFLDTYQAIIPLAKQRDILLVTPSASRESFTPENVKWPVTFYHNSTIEIAELMRGLKERGYSRPAVIYEQEPFAEMIRKLVISHGTKLVDDIGVQGGEVDFKSLLTKLKTKNPDVLIVFVWDERSRLSLLQQLRVFLPELMLATVHDGIGWLADPTFRPLLSRLTYSSFVITDTSFSDHFKKRFGYEPILTASNAYDALNAVLAAFAAEKKTGSEIRSFLLSEEHDTVTFGKLAFAKDGSVPSKVIVVDFPSRAIRKQ